MIVMHRLELERTILAVDLINQLRDLRPKLGGISRTRRGDLNKDNLLSPLRIIPQEALKGTELKNDDG